MNLRPIKGTEFRLLNHFTSYVLDTVRTVTVIVVKELRG